MANGSIANQEGTDSVTSGQINRRQAWSLGWIVGTFLVGLLGALLLLGAVRADSASADAEILDFNLETTESQAGGHPNLIINMHLDGAVKDTLIEFPAGFIGNPHVTPKCTLENFGVNLCPTSAQMGIVFVTVEFGFGMLMPLYNMVPAPGQAGLLAFQTPVLGSGPVFIEISARTDSDFGLDAKVVNIPQIAGIQAFTQVLWGVPADPVHTPVRLPISQASQGQMWCGFLFGLQPDITKLLVQDVLPAQCNNTWQDFKPLDGGGVPSDVPEAPFLSNSTRCTGPLEGRLKVIPYSGPSSEATSMLPEMTGCDQLTFDPSLAAKPTTTWTDTASGLDIDLVVPQFQSTTTPSPSPIRRATMTLPEGFSLNPNAADGKDACTDEQARFGTKDPAQCPEHSKIGTTEIESSALPGPIFGGLYIGEPKPGQRYRVVLTGSGFGTHIKQLGVVTPDPDTGQLVVDFDELPESPVQRTSIHVFGSERGLLATPTQCGTYPVRTKFVPWNDELGSQESTQFFTLDSGPAGSSCPTDPRAFNPRMQAGSDDNTAGAHSSFGIELRRDDGHQNVTRLTVNTPPGFSAKLAGVPYCPESALASIGAPGYTGLAERASSLCPLASQIGKVTAGAGAGTRPLHVDGKVYLAGPYQGAPLSLVVVIPAVSGPFDLGNVTVRAALHVDPVTAQVRAVSDPFPQILDGIPLRARFLGVLLDRPDFVINPTNCDPFAVRSDVYGDGGGFKQLSSHFQVANCTDLPFGPKLGLRLRGATKRRGHPAIRAVLGAGAGDANIKRVQVTLPKGQLLDNSHIETVCTRPDFAAEACPVGSMVGQAEAVTPLLAEPLTGSVHLRSSSNRLPDLVIDLEGQVDVELAGRVDSVNGRLRTTFEGVPDVPVSRFVLNLVGGRKGLVINSEGLCGRAKRAKVVMVGQNGVRRVRNPKVRTGCGSRSSSKRKRQNQRRAGIRLARKAG
jgi:hypothetical protein